MVQGYWIKKFTSLHDRLANQLNDCFRSGRVPAWMTKGKTVLIQKDKAKGTVVGNYRPITCLPLMWKVLTGIIYHHMYQHLENHGILPQEQKGCRRGTRGTKDHLMLDKMITKNALTKKKNLSMAWIDYKKAYDMVPHSWIHECLKIYGISPRTRKFLENTMPEWRVMLTSANNQLGEVNIKRGIFQGDSLSPLLFVLSMIPMTEALRTTGRGFKYDRNNSINHLLYMDDLKLYAGSTNDVDTLVQTVHTISEDIRMEFGISKCGMLNIKKGRVTSSEGIEINEERIKDIEEEGYKYLGVMEHDTILHTQMKDTIRKEYINRTRLVLKSHLNGGNTIKAINTWAIPVIRYTAGIIN